MQTDAQALGGALDKVPGGWVFPRDPASVLGRTLAPLAHEQVLFEQAAEALLEEATPSTATSLLPDYERVLGPDPCVASSSATFDQRRLSVHARWVGTQGASRADFIGLAARYGFAIAITEFRHSRFGRTFGLPFGGEAWSYTWRVSVAALSLRPFSFGAGRFGDPFRSWGDAVLECALRRAAPEHTILQIAYTGPAGVAATWDTGPGWDAGTGWAAGA